jgi:hypothetical protein
MCGCNRAKKSLTALRAGGPAARSVPSVSSVPGIPTVDTSVWGAPTWIALHIASVFSSQNLPLWKELLAALQNDIPCPDCRAHFSRWVQSHPFRSSSILPIRRLMGHRSTHPKIVLWLLGLHNDVNSRTGIPAWNEQQILKRYGGDRSSRLIEGRASLETVRGILGNTSFSLLMRLLG